MYFKSDASVVLPSTDHSVDRAHDCIAWSSYLNRSSVALVTRGEQPIPSPRSEWQGNCMPAVHEFNLKSFRNVVKVKLVGGTTVDSRV